MIVVGVAEETPSAPTLVGFFDPAARTTAVITELPEHRFGERSVVLGDGRVLIAGGLDNVEGSMAASASVRLFDPNTGAASKLGPMRASDDVPLGDGRVALVADDEGAPRNAVEILTVGS